ncbi:MAG: RC-LH1 core complex protein PufX [Gemmobacter sp.]
MNEKPYWDDGHAAMLRTWVLGQMLRGAGFAAVFVFVIGLTLWAIWGVGLLLPPESKEAPDPMGSLVTEVATQVA